MSNNNGLSAAELSALKAQTTLYTPTSHIPKDEHTLTVKNLAPSITSQELVAFFKPCGKIINVNVIRNQKNQFNKAYVELADKGMCELGLALNGSVFKGNKLFIKMKMVDKRKINK